VVSETLEELLAAAREQCDVLGPQEQEPWRAFEVSLLEHLYACPVPVEVVRALWRVVREGPMPRALSSPRGWLRLVQLMRQGSYVCRTLAQSPEMIDEILGQEQDHKEPRHELAGDFPHVDEHPVLPQVVEGTIGDHVA